MQAALYATKQVVIKLPTSGHLFIPSQGGQAKGDMHVSSLTQPPCIFSPNLWLALLLRGATEPVSTMGAEATLRRQGNWSRRPPSLNLGGIPQRRFELGFCLSGTK